MKYQKIKNLPDGQFRRVTGVKRTTFTKMVEILTEAQTKKKSKGCRPNKLYVEDMLLMALEYIREYRTYIHIATSYGLAESNAYETIKWVENTLIKHPDFRLPGRKALLKSDHELSSKRTLNEHIIGRIKRFKIVADKYRNRRKRFGLRFNLISAICNFELAIM